MCLYNTLGRKAWKFGKSCIPEAIFKMSAVEISEATRLGYNNRISLKFDRHFGSAAVEMLVKYQSVWESLNPNLAASRLPNFLR